MLHGVSACNQTISYVENYFFSFAKCCPMINVVPWKWRSSSTSFCFCNSFPWISHLFKIFYCYSLGVLSNAFPRSFLPWIVCPEVVQHVSWICYLILFHTPLVGAFPSSTLHKFQQLILTKCIWWLLTVFLDPLRGYYLLFNQFSYLFFF